MDIIEEYIVRRGGMVESYQRELRSKFQSVNYCIVDFVEGYLDKEGQQLIAEILTDFVDNYIYQSGVKSEHIKN